MQTLQAVPTGHTVTLGRVNCEPAVCRRLHELGLRAGTQVTIGQRTSGGGRVVTSGTARYAIDKETLCRMECLLESLVS